MSTTTLATPASVQQAIVFRDAEALRDALRGLDRRTFLHAGRYALHYCAQLDFPDGCLVAINLGIDVNAPDPHTQRRALHLAAQDVSVNSLRTLLAQGADLEARDQEGHTPLLAAVRANRGAIAETLLDLGADIEARCFVNATPLGYALIFGTCEIVDLLLSRGADQHALQGVGEAQSTPHFLAADPQRRLKPGMRELLMAHARQGTLSTPSRGPHPPPDTGPSL